MKKKKAAAKNKVKTTKKTTRIEKLEVVVSELSIRVKNLEAEIQRLSLATATVPVPPWNDWKNWPIYWGISGKTH